MRGTPTNICPLRGYPCVGSRCAWWDFGGNECALTTAAFAIREVAENLETLASKSQAPGILDKKPPADATNIDEGKAEKVLEGSISASIIPKTEEEIK